MTPVPPVAPTRPHVHEIHGDRREDPYYWLRERDQQEVLDYLQEENEYADAFMAPHEELQHTLFEEIKNRIPQKDSGVPQIGRDGWWYSWFINEGQDYPTYVRTRGDECQTLLDLNLLAEGHEFVDLGGYACPRDTTLMWYTIDYTGFRQYQLRVKDLKRGLDLELSALENNPEFGRVAGFTLVENRDDALWFVVEDETTQRHSRLYYWQLGDKAPRLIYHEEDERFNLCVGKSADFKKVVVSLASHTTCEVWLADAASTNPKIERFLPRVQDRELDVDCIKGNWFICTNDVGRNNRLVRAPDANPETWVELIPHRDDVLLEGFELFDQFLVTHERHEGITKLFVYDLDGGNISGRREVLFPELTISAGSGENYITDTHVLRVSYESQTTPRVTYDCDMRTMALREIKRQEVLGDYNPTRYTSCRLHATASDGTQIPLTVTYRKDLKLDGTAPCLLSGYGAYGLSSDIHFSSSMLSLIDRGFVYAIAHVRGGSELGKPWHDAGRLENKINSFTDFISCAEYLIAQNFTRAKSICIEGASAGGLLVGAVANMRPDLFGIVCAEVPFVDVLTTMLDPSMPLVVGEYEEWGDPSVAEEYFRMKEYSPLDNIQAKEYPAMLVRTAYNDSQVMYWEPAKYVAKLRATKTDSNPILFKCNMDCGHGGSSGRFDAYRDFAFDFAFICTQFGVLK